VTGISAMCSMIVAIVGFPDVYLARIGAQSLGHPIVVVCFVGLWICVVIPLLSLLGE
jgi:hypothetical protein